MTITKEECLQGTVSVSTSKGDVTLNKSDNQNQYFVPVTRSLDLLEAVEFALNTNTFKPLILEKRYRYGRHKYYYVVKPVQKGGLIKKGVLWELCKTTVCI